MIEEHQQTLTNHRENIEYIFSRIKAIEETIATIITWQIQTIGSGGVEQLLAILNKDHRKEEKEDEQ